MSMVLSGENVFGVFSEWTKAEHTRLHGPGKSVMTNVSEMRRASALDFADIGNVPVAKCLQHISRMRQRVTHLKSTSFDPEFTGRALSDCLKLLAGQQIKRLLAVAQDQDDFARLVRQPELGLGFTIDNVMDQELDEIGNINDEVDILQFRLNGSLRQIVDRAVIGTDWGKEHSPMVTSAWLGEVACARMAVATMSYVAMAQGGYQNVPLRSPASDAETSAIQFPFM